MKGLLKGKDDLTTIQGFQQLYSATDKYGKKSFKEIPEDHKQKLAEFLIERELNGCYSELLENRIYGGDHKDTWYDDVKNYELDEVESGDQLEPLEWWAVSSWMFEKLNEKKEVIITPNDFNYFWGRTCSGQSIALDNVIQLIAYETYI